MAMSGDPQASRSQQLIRDWLLSSRLMVQLACFLIWFYAWSKFSRP